jgi:transcriptional regulator with XRE-family HTH domain
MMFTPEEASARVPGGENTGHGRKVKFGQMLESLIERGGYSRNRKKILSRLGISGSALSQYIHQQTWPSFTKLLAIADFFDVSLDYLVYGQPVSGSLIDYGPLYRYVDHALADVQARGSRHSAVVARIGRMLADRIDVVAAELASTPIASRVGLLQDEEGLRLESYCRDVNILSLDLQFDIISVEGEPAAGRFLHVVAANLERGVDYRFLLPQDQQWDTTVEACRRLLADQIGGDRVRECCAFRLTSVPVLTGAALYQLDAGRLEAEEPALHAQIHDYFDEDDWLGFIIRPNSDSNSDMLMDPANARRARHAFDRMWSSGTAI